jgi:cytochrome c-type biogenesis protein CcsB
MSSSLFFDLSAGAYIIALITYVIYLVVKNKTVGLAASAITIAGFISQSTALIIRWVDSYYFWMGSHPASGFIEALLRAAPLRNLYESLIFFVWCLILAHLLIEFIYKNRSLGAFVTPLAALAILFIDISGTSKDIQPLIPALQSNWLLFHVLLSFIGYAAFGVSFGAAAAYIVLVTESKHELTYIFWSLVIGIFLIVLAGMGIDFLFPLFTVGGLIMGAIWANSAWGKYWTWGPKETWSLITWIVYALYLHARYVGGWRGKRVAILSVVGFIAVIFTYLGVNLVLSGLHAYGSG